MNSQNFPSSYFVTNFVEVQEMPFKIRFKSCSHK